jgi:8-oxo-dGTP diphosphatase
MGTGQSKAIVFGTPDAAFEYKPRRAAYAVIADGSGRIAAVSARYGYFLPGGGSLPGEMPEQTIMREALEELGRDVRIVRLVGEAVQYFSGDGQCYRMEAVFFAAEFAGETTSAGEHELRWVESDEVERVLYHQCHAWAARRVLGEPSAA